MIIRMGAWLRKGAKRFTGEEPVDILGLGAEAQARSESSVRYDLTAQWASGELVMRGTLEMAASLRCARCAEWFAATLRDPSFLRSIPLASETDAIDLTPDIREAMVLAIPFVTYCSPSCKGLCPRCGANLNRESCACAGREANSALGVLNQMRIP